MDDEQSPIGVTVEGRVIVEDVRHMRERVGQDVVLSFVRHGRPETVEFLDSPAHDSGGTTKFCVLPPVCRKRVELVISWQTAVARATFSRCENRSLLVPPADTTASSTSIAASPRLTVTSTLPDR
jgi:hypothetical protein